MAWLKLFILILLMGVAKASQIRMVLLALLGLAGVWMMRNYSAASSGDPGARMFPNFSFSEIATRVFSKRSLDQEQVQLRLDWDKVLYNDVSTCTRSYICQLSATPWETLSDNERAILNFVSNTNWSSKQASKELELAINIGNKFRNPAQCRKVYLKCPYSSSTMVEILNMLGDKS